VSDLDERRSTVPAEPPAAWLAGDIITFWNEVRPTNRYLFPSEASYVFDPYWDRGSVAVFTRRDDLDKVLRDHEHFINRSEIHPERRLPPEDTDGAEHARYRKYLDPHFTVRRLSRLEDGIVQLVSELIDGVLARGRCEYIEDFAATLSTAVFMPLMGLPEGELDWFRKLFGTVVRPEGQTPEEQVASSKRASEAIYAYYASALDHLASTPNEGVLSSLLTSEVDGVRLTRDEILDIAFLMAIAGIDTVKTNLAAQMWHFATNRDDRQQLLDDPAVIPMAIEELFRYHSTNFALRRVCSADTEIGGCPIHAGDKVLLSVASANHDDTKFRDPETVDFHRKAVPHLNFGGGIHYCLGANLARLELRLALREWHRRIPEYHVDPGVDVHWINFGVRSPNTLPLIVG
jgi:cytochrome P450